MVVFRLINKLHTPMINELQRISAAVPTNYGQQGEEQELVVVHGEDPWN
jgi:hypothetical protein